MSFPNRDAQILTHILEYCNRIERTLSRFGKDFDVFLEDQDYMDSVSMNLLQIGELAGKFSDAYVQSKICAICSRTIMARWTKIASGRQRQKTFRRSKRIVNVH